MENNWLNPLVEQNVPEVVGLSAYVNSTFSHIQSYLVLILKIKFQLTRGFNTSAFWRILNKCSVFCIHTEIMAFDLLVSDSSLACSVPFIVPRTKL